MDLLNRINGYLKENSKPNLFGKKLLWKKSKNRGYFIADIPTKEDYTLQVEWSPEDPDIIEWAEVKGKKIGNSGSDDIEDFQDDWKKEVKS